MSTLPTNVLRVDGGSNHEELDRMGCTVGNSGSTDGSEFRNALKKTKVVRIHMVGNNLRQNLQTRPYI